MYQKLLGLNYIQGQTVNELVMDAMACIDEHAPKLDSRNGGARPIYNAEMVLIDPRERHLDLIGRTSNIFQMIAETFWVCSGRGDVDGYLSYFLPRALDYSDDGKTWRGAYGPRIFEYGQLDGVVERFKKDGKFTRRAVVDIYQSEKDTPDSIRSEYGLEDSKDIPCNDFILFWIEDDNSFHMKTIQRSGDVIFGAGSINMFEFSFLQEMVFQKVKALYPEIHLGYYHHNTTNLHLYDFTAKQCGDVLDQRPQQVTQMDITEPTIFSSSIQRDCKFFKKLLKLFELQMGTGKKYENPILDIVALFNKYNIPIDNNQLWTYVTLVNAYIWAKESPDTLPEIPYTFAERSSSVSLENAVKNSKFRKFPLNTETRF